MKSKYTNEKLDEIAQYLIAIEYKGELLHVMGYYPSFECEDDQEPCFNLIREINEVSVETIDITYNEIREDKAVRFFIKTRLDINDNSNNWVTINEH